MTYKKLKDELKLLKDELKLRKIFYDDLLKELEFEELQKANTVTLLKEVLVLLSVDIDPELITGVIKNAQERMDLDAKINDKIMYSKL